MNTPVLFLVFNRPDVTMKVFKRIQEVKPKKLYIACDGPRETEGETEINLVKEVQQICQNINWDCEVKTLYRPVNLGCKLAVSGAIDWIFSQEERAIILEDDCLPDPSFFTFCDKLLATYCEDKQIMHIGGYKPLEIPAYNYDISFTRITHVWGWATWRDRWKKYKLTINTNEMNELNILDQYEFFQSKRKTTKRQKLLQNLYQDKINTWDYQWNYTVRTNSGLAIRPNINLVENIGHGHENATHTFSPNQKSNPAFNLNVESMVLPTWIMINRATEQASEQLL